ncbi:transcriptional regulator [Pelotomaculum thermopropionicum SI]|uniref:HTH-type transcriptional regulatory protein TyrR n=1 Tax=Pelotomaculum thermopropionicum (strain DSM 13744 / JCM 10971 / SI) TaxID=370438 RepID=A5D1E1_PELTS|nr:transcriptional regulator [Pelotomaculum thermopropionicum SI]
MIIDNAIPASNDSSEPFFIPVRNMGILEARRFASELEQVLEASHDGIFITDGQGVILRVNSAWERICGISRDFVVGKNAQEMVDKGFWSESAAICALKAKKEVTIMLKMTKGEKVGQKIMATGIPVMDDEGNIKRVVVNVRDITEIVNLRDQLEETQQLNEKYAAELEQMRIQHVQYDNIVASSPKTKRVLDMAAQVAKVDSTVLITGESGVGKEIVANVIHCLSHRSKGPLIKINCGAIPENLLESELFGYEPGAFTGARKQGKPGMFELAEKGTLFLDEVGELSLNLQVKLLRVLQDHEVLRVGGLKPIPVDVRIVAATNKDLMEMVRKEKFRDDLYYRLNVVSIEIPPLRERREDIPLLALHFLEKINKKYGFNKRFAPDVIDRLSAYPWPGNIRELENVIERVMVMTKSDEIRTIHLPGNIKNLSSLQNDIMFSEIMPLKKAVEHVEKHLIEQALKKYGSTRKVARALKVNQSTIVRKIKKYKLSAGQELDVFDSYYDEKLRI